MPGNGPFKGEIFVIDDDTSMRETLSHTLAQSGYDVISFADSAALLFHAKVRTPVCIFLEMHPVDQTGLELLKRLHSEHCPVPVFVTSATSAIAMAVDAIRNGAYDFIVKPFCSMDMANRIEAAIDEYSERAVYAISNMSLYVPGTEPLTGREREVLARIAVGETNKEAARRLGLSARTVEGYRANIMRKIGAKNAAELLRLVFEQERHA